MNSEFPSLLSGLRKAKGVSQRQAAESLQVSQALLSHYENGIREPGFDFMIRVSEYYGISVDYLLGRTTVRQNPFLTDHIMPKFAADLSEEVLSKLNEESRLLLTSLSLTLVLLARTSGAKGIDCASECFKTQIYRIFRLMKLYLGENGFDYIDLPIGESESACTAAEGKAITELIRHLSGIAKESIHEDNTKLHFAEDVMRRRFVNTFDSFEEVILSTDKKLRDLAGEDTE